MTQNRPPGVAGQAADRANVSGAGQLRNSAPAAEPQAAARTIREAAIDYARNGWEIMPRRPVGTGLLIDCLTGSPRTGLQGEDEVASYWSACPHAAALAVVCGPASGVLVLDVDQHGGGADGLAELRRLEAEHGTLPATPFVLSPSGAGRHIYFRWPASPIRTGVLAPGVEILGDRAAANLPPSMKRGSPYRWSLSRHPDFLPLAGAPEWLMRLARPPEPKPRIRPRIGSRDRYARAALERECAAIAVASPGTRNHTLNRAAWSIARLDLDGGDIEAALLDAATAAGMPPGEAQTTIRSGLRRRA